MKAYIQEAAIGALCGIVVAMLIFAGWFVSLLLTHPAIVLAGF
jgi:hypothetical protein